MADDVRKKKKKSEVERLLGAADKIKSLTNWQPKYNLHDGLKQTIEWFSKPENLKQYKADIYNV